MRFFGSAICTSAQYCEVCRSSAKWREQHVRLYDDLVHVNFACPYNGEPPRAEAPMPDWLEAMDLPKLVAMARECGTDARIEGVIKYMESRRYERAECSPCAAAQGLNRLRKHILEKHGPENI